MTTIACDGRSMASDGMVTENDHICRLDFPKVRRLKDGRIVGMSGDAYAWQPFMDWLETGEGTPPVADDGLSCLVLNLDGSLCSYDKHGNVFPEVAPVAIGSGTRFALAAMDFGKNAEDAVNYACTRDVYSGGLVTVLALEPAVKAVA